MTPSLIYFFILQTSPRVKPKRIDQNALFLDISLENEI